MAFDTAALNQWARQILDGERGALSRAITLAESGVPAHIERAAALREHLVAGGAAQRSAASHRIGMSGLPGAGKSTLIDALGVALIERGHRVAVLAVDPSSPRTGGSILGDKTRMERLSRMDAAYIRPSPSAGGLGGVAARTHEAIALVEAAGFDVVIVETVGVGQSEVAVADLVDTFVAVMIPGGGDELQGVKRGLLELVDVVFVNKADGDAMAAATRSQTMHARSLELMVPREACWQPVALRGSARTGEGIAELLTTVQAHREALAVDGRLLELRAQRAQTALWRRVEAELLAELEREDCVRAALPETLEALARGVTTPTQAAHQLLRLFRGARDVGAGTAGAT